MAAAPLISCLTITRDRRDMLERAVDFYVRQTWPARELIIVVDRRGNLEWVEAFRSTCGRSDIRIEIPPAVTHIGALRNHSIDLARGEYVCIWDDDDWYHPLRLERQEEALGGADAVYLEDVMHYFTDAGEMFVERVESTGFAASLLCRREAIPRFVERPISAQHGERGSDTVVRMRLEKDRKVALLRGLPWLYTYVYQGSNLWPRAHHVGTAFELSPPGEVLRGMLPGLRGRLLEYFPCPVPAGLTCGDGGNLPLEVP